MKITQIKREEELYRLFLSLPAPGCRFQCISGESVFLISPGEPNTGAGPDFLNAVLLINGTLTAGHVEMHMRESDWFAHGHQRDHAYQEVVLHVLAEDSSAANLRLNIPTTTAGELRNAFDSEAVPQMEQPSEHAGLSLGLIAEYSWARFLRRSTGILRRAMNVSEERIEEAFLLGLFDSLGYSRNRKPMKEIATRLLELRSELYEADFDTTVTLLFSVGGIPGERLEKVGKSFMPAKRLRAVLPPMPPQKSTITWDYRGRPANSPERRLWAGAKLLFDCFHRDLLERALQQVSRQAAVGTLRTLFHVRLGSETLLGNSRADEIIVNVLCPVALSAGILRNDAALLEGACLLYRYWPGLASNRIVRNVESRFAGGEKLDGAFYQQGAIEYYQKILSPDRSGYSMIAEQSGAKAN